MTLEEIKANAPKGATHYRKLTCSARYLGLFNGLWCFWNGYRWHKFQNQSDVKKMMIIDKVKPL